MGERVEPLPQSRIVGTGHFLPPVIRTNDDLATMVEEHRELLAALQTRDLALMRSQLDLHIAVPSPPSTARATPNRRKAAGAKLAVPGTKAGT